jgi:DNA processing protein
MATKSNGFNFAGQRVTDVDELTALIALSKLSGLTRQKKRELLGTAGTAQSLFRGRGPFPDSTIGRKAHSFKGWKEIEKELVRLQDMGIEAVSLNDDKYPPLLREIPDAPLVLYCRGPLRVSSNVIAIVGSRRATVEGINLSERIAETLSSLGITIVSGLARGIDAASHRGALREGGKTVAVLGCGIDICYPAENRPLFEEIGRQGILATEYGLGERPLRYHFPERNRIIAGISRGVLVVEATQRSGSLITARLGTEYGRDVMSVPGNVFSETHKGTNSLIKEGAKLVAGIEDILVHTFPQVTVKQRSSVDLDKEEDYIYSLMGDGKIHIDEIIEKSGYESKEVLGILTKLEMKDTIRGFPGGFYIRR